MRIEISDAVRRSMGYPIRHSRSNVVPYSFTLVKNIRLKIQQ
jgi:hypothetical protein